MGLETIKEHADAEADEAERDGADEAPEQAPEREAEQASDAPHAPDAAPMGERELKALAKKIDAASDAHAKKLRDLLGAQFESWFPCPLCMTDGHVDPATLATIEPERVEAIRAAVGFEPDPELKEADDVDLCAKCDGWGVVTTGSKRDEHRVKNCNNCAGRGYIEKVAEQTPWTPPPPPPPSGPNGITYPPVTGELDAWNRPAGHPHYGIAPALVTG